MPLIMPPQLGARRINRLHHGLRHHRHDQLRPRRGVHDQRTGLEPATPGVTGRYSNRLNYRFSAFMVSSMRRTSGCTMIGSAALSGNSSTGCSPPSRPVQYANWRSFSPHRRCRAQRRQPEPRGWRERRRVRHRPDQRALLAGHHRHRAVHRLDVGQGMVMSLILLAPSWGGMINGMMTLSGRPGRRGIPRS